MNKIKNAVENLLKNLSNTKHPPSKVTNEMLSSEGLTGITPHDYQLYAIDWMTSSFVTRCEAGVIIGDEMGLGKTLQSVASLLHLKSSKTTSGPFLILSPLSVVDSWKKEFQRCAPPLEVFTYIGNKEEREILRKDIETSYSLTNSSVMKSQTAPFDVLLTSYEVFLKDSCFLERFCWKVLIVDEAHRLKNHNSLLYRQLKELDIGFKILLTGTPVQNNLTEIYSLLSFVAPNVFHLDNMQGFVDHFSNIVAGGSSSPTIQQELHDLLAPFLLRRVKNEVMKNLPKKCEVLLHCGMSEEQKSLYIAILTKNLGAFNNEGKTRLMNILMQLRKCCNHPYIFPGIEKEPYILGEHIVETSGKLHLLDKLLSFLKASGHKVLLFSQMTTMLDIIQDYLGYREYSYERLDGSVRGEERYLAVNNFNETKDTFIFLLSTRAGGQGLNLVSADTVIFIDNDFNPQNDLQAAARAHRIGQKRPVKIIRLVTKNSVEEIILKRAERKLKLTNVVVEGGQFSNLKNSATADELSSTLMFGLEEIMNHQNEGKFEEVDFESILGRTSNSEWEEISTVADQKPNNPVTEEKTAENIYEYNGKDYAQEINDDDKNAFDKLIQDVTQDKERSLRKDPKSTAVFSLDTKKRKRRVLTEEEKEALKITREANKAKRVKLLEEKALEKREKLWKSLNYTSYNVHLPDEESDDVISTCSDDDVIQQINYVIGDVTNPKSRQQEAIVVHCVDDSGYWGNGGLFTAINKQSTFPKQQYELASKAQDLNLGDVHLVKMKESPTIYAGLLVVHSRDRKNRLSPLHLNHLNTALEKLSHVAKQTGAHVHFPRIGHNSANFNWYGIERLIKKCFTQRNIPTYVYYFKRTTPFLPATTTQATTSTAQAHASVPGSSQLSPDSPSTADNLADIFTDCVVYLDGKLDDPTKRRISRYVVAYDGDVDKVVTEDTTHVVVKDDGDFSYDDIKCDVKIVGVSWVERCIKVGKRIPEEKYLIVKQ